MSKAEDILAFHLHAANIPHIQQFRFCQRKWAADFAFPEARLLVEVEGGVWTQGRHVRGQGFINDCRKYNEAVLLGWRLLRFTPQMVDDGTALQTIERALGVTQSEGDDA